MVVSTSIVVVLRIEDKPFFTTFKEFNDGIVIFGDERLPVLEEEILFTH